MSLLSRIIPYKTKEVYINVSNEAEGKDLDKVLDKQIIERIRESLRDWSDAVLDWENPHMGEGSKYLNMLNLFHNIELDEHITALKDTIYYRISQTPFYVIDRNGEKDEEKTILFEKSWFSDFIKYALETDYWGFTLIYLEVLNGNINKCESVDRYHIRPNQKGVSKSKFNDYPDIKFDEKPYSDITLFLTNKEKFGRYAKVAKKFILKRDVEQFWAIFNELFTTPHYTVKTNFNNKNHRNDLLKWLTNRKHSGFTVVGLDDEINALNNNGQGYQSYMEFKKSANEDMSKAFLGQTMVFEDGSSRSQAEVHERQMDSFIQAKRVWLTFIINERLIPLMQLNGIKITSEDEFKWDLSENISIKDYATILQQLSSFYNFNEEEIQDKLGMEVTLKEQIPSVGENKAQNIFAAMNNKIKELYK